MRAEPCLGGFLHESILRHTSLMEALGSLLSHKLSNPVMSPLTLLDLVEEAFARDHFIEESVLADLQKTALASIAAFEPSHIILDFIDELQTA